MRLLFILLLVGCTSTQSNENETRIDALWCLGFCQHVEAKTDTETRKTTEEVPEDE